MAKRESPTNGQEPRRSKRLRLRAERANNANGNNNNNGGHIGQANNDAVTEQLEQLVLPRTQNGRDGDGAVADGNSTAAGVGRPNLHLANPNEVWLDVFRFVPRHQSQALFETNSRFRAIAQICFHQPTHVNGSARPVPIPNVRIVCRQVLANDGAWSVEEYVQTMREDGDSLAEVPLAEMAPPPIFGDIQRLQIDPKFGPKTIAFLILAKVGHSILLDMHSKQLINAPSVEHAQKIEIASQERNGPFIEQLLAPPPDQQCVRFENIWALLASKECALLEQLFALFQRRQLYIHVPIRENALGGIFTFGRMSIERFCPEEIFLDSLILGLVDRLMLDKLHSYGRFLHTVGKWLLHTGTGTGHQQGGSSPRCRHLAICSPIDFTVLARLVQEFVKPALGQRQEQQSSGASGAASAALEVPLFRVFFTPTDESNAELLEAIVASGEETADAWACSISVRKMQCTDVANDPSVGQCPFGDFYMLSNADPGVGEGLRQQHFCLPLTTVSIRMP